MQARIASDAIAERTATMILADMLEFKVFTGNFFVLVPLRVIGSGQRAPGMRFYEHSCHGAVESGCEVPAVEIQRVPDEQEMTFVGLFGYSCRSFAYDRCV